MRSLSTFYKSSSWCCHRVFRMRWLRGARPIFSKTGVWNPQLSLNTRLEIEDHWMPLVQEHDRIQTEITNASHEGDREKYYALSMFPYPSGNLHLGHVRVYTISDVMARYQRSKGKLVIHPMGWDAFGLPAENAAIERGIHPYEWTRSNITRMKEQFRALGLSFDWSREFATCYPSYYKWTQYIFLKMFEKGLAFQKKGLVNWDPVDLTVLADAQIDDNGFSWRSGAKAEKKYLKQWYLRDTTFSQSLLDGLEEVDPALWRDIILVQKNWISECTGHRIDFNIELEDGSAHYTSNIYTENLDLIYGVSHLFVSPSHYLCVDYEITEEGSLLPAFAIHPFTKERLPIVVTQEKHFFKNRDIMLGIPSVSPHARLVAEGLQIPFRGVLDADQEVLINSDELTGLSRMEALEEVQQTAAALGIGGEKISEKLNDWLISRQRYWGTPIPVIHCTNCKVVPVPYEDLPVELPQTKTLVGKGGRSPLEENEAWFNVSCPRCGGPAKREVDTMDTFVDSAWYFLRYLDPKNTSLPFDPEIVNQYMPVDLYVGGKEHATLHLYFARFVCHFLNSIGLLKYREPFKNLLTQGMVKGESFKVKDTGKYIHKSQADLSGKIPIEADTGKELIVHFEKMSKSKNNGVNPEDILAEFGVDSTRLCILSNVSPMSERNWSTDVFKGVLSWQGKIWNLISKQRNFSESRKNRSETTKTSPNLSNEELMQWERRINDTRNHIINNVTFQFERTFHINSAISRLHSYVGYLSKVPEDVAKVSEAYERALGDMIVMLSPMAPHFASELWAGLAGVVLYDSHQWEQEVLSQSWPSVDAEFLMPLTYMINKIQISEIGVPYKSFNDLSEQSAFDLVKQDPIFQEKYSNLKISSSDFKIDKGHKATLNLKVPGFDFGVEGSTTSEKGKKMKKLAKQKNKLHKMNI